VGTGASDQFAAMPSIHVAWACIVCFGIFTSTTSRWRWIGPIHLALTFWCVMATANHWWMDGLVACALVGLSLLIDDGARRLLARRGRRGRGPADEDPTVSQGASPPVVGAVPSASA